MTLDFYFKQINLHFFCFIGWSPKRYAKGILMELQTEKIKDKINMNCPNNLRIKNQAVFPYEE